MIVAEGITTTVTTTPVTGLDACRLSGRFTQLRRIP